MRTTLVIAAVLTAAPAALAADLKVGKGKPYRTISDAVAVAKAGDRILVGPGVYKDAIRLQFLDDVQFIGKGAVWDGQNLPGAAGTCLSGTGNGIVVSGFKFRNGVSHVAIEGAGGAISNCVSRGANTVAFDVQGDGWRIEKCEVVGASWGSISVSGKSAVVTGNKVRNGDSGGIHVVGDAARVEKNDVRTIEDELGIAVTGADAKVLGNTVINTDYESIYVSGDRAQVLGNRCSYTSTGAAIHVVGDAMEVGANRVAYAAGGLLLSGDAVNVHDNVVDATIRNTVGIFVDGHSGAGGGVVARNKVTDASQTGFALIGPDLLVDGNTAVTCGRGGGVGGFVLAGNAIAAKNCVADSCRKAGFVASGASLQIAGCTAKNCVGDGFRVNGQSAQLSNLVATGNGGEGLDNRGTATKAQGCKLTGNRLDVACDVGSGASFDGGLDGNTYKTGGESQLPEVDN